MDVAVLTLGVFVGMMAGMLVMDWRSRMALGTRLTQSEQEARELLKAVQVVNNNLVTQVAAMQETVNKHEVLLSGKLMR